MTPEEFASTVKLINTIIAALFWLCCAYRIFYLFVPFFRKIRPNKNPSLHRIAILIAARNEEKTLPLLLESIRAQDYPAELMKVFVVADNCTDSTAEKARELGAGVCIRNDKSQIGKGYALNFLLEHIHSNFGADYFDGYIVVDADNLLSPNYVTEMNKTFSEGYNVLTSYRNSKNYGDNWISSGYALWFLHEAKYLNYSRCALGTSCAVSGTGFMFSREILKKAGGWNFFLLTEDIEFTTWLVIHGETVGYCPHAVLFDEQPASFRQSWRQRLRWGKGYIQVLKKYGLRLFGGIFKARGFACYDMVMSMLPAVVFTVLGLTLDTSAAIATLIAGENVLPFALMVLKTLGSAYGSMFVLGIFPLISEWKHIRATAIQKICSLFTFPLFMMTYIPISIASLVLPVEWKPIEHNRTIRMSDLK